MSNNLLLVNPVKILCEDISLSVYTEIYAFYATFLPLMLFYNEFLRCFLKVALSLKKKRLEFQYLFFYGDIFF